MKGPRLFAALSLAFALTAVPIASVQACSCGMLGGPADIIATSDLAFVGTVASADQKGNDPAGFGQMIRYAFLVERASAPIDGSVVHVDALGGDGGASCGFTFGMGERWLVDARLADDGSLMTGLCSGNAMIEQMGEAELAAVVELLPVTPDPDADGPEGGTIDVPMPVIFGGLAVAGLVAVSLIAFRRGGPARPS